MQLKETVYPSNAQEFIKFHSEMYHDAFKNGDRRGMAESAGILCVSFAAARNPDLARRWSEEFFANLDTAPANPQNELPAGESGNSCP